MNKLRQRWGHSQFICATIFPFIRIGHFFYLLSPSWRFRVHTVIWIPRYPIQESRWWDLPKESSFETLKSYNKPMSSYNIGRSSITSLGETYNYTHGVGTAKQTVPLRPAPYACLAGTSPSVSLLETTQFSWILLPKKGGCLCQAMRL